MAGCRIKSGMTEVSISDAVPRSATV
ncbi:hypothetical protein AGR13a_Cc320053 [Agrobacterium genomosp. 13 str. CFBP 6927]|uniref:Uncharacterized protein n=1 Tax=Agrobacterium genomosp. 13 str. CFBP 6927 TaxID=1183428 RepID=A0ABM9VGS6_9HYPH|nr:hypothetical protein AGR13a_Cc320053 [Agrobacterium genomosp. 13 str. CFBP 6927]